MVKMTLIARVTDGLPLAEGLDDGRDLPDSDMYKQQDVLRLLAVSPAMNFNPEKERLKEGEAADEELRKRAADELTEQQSRQLHFDLESSYNSFMAALPKAGN